MLPTSTLFCAKEMETKIRPAFAHFSLRAKKISKMEDYRSSIDCFLSVFSGLVLWINLLRYFILQTHFWKYFCPLPWDKQTFQQTASFQKMHAYFFLTFIQCECFTHFYYKSLQIHKNNNCGYPIVCLTYEASGLRLYGMWCWILEQAKRLRWNCSSLAILMYNNVFFFHLRIPAGSNRVNNKLFLLLDFLQSKLLELQNAKVGIQMTQKEPLTCIDITCYVQLK